MPAKHDPTGRRIYAGSLLAVQFERFKVTPVAKKKERNKSYRLIVGGENLNSTWFTDRPKRLTGKFQFDDITGKAVWKGLYGNDNPNSALSGSGRTIIFETGFFKERANGTYVSRINLNGNYGDQITGIWKDASLVIDDTQGTYNFGSTYVNNSGSGAGSNAVITTGGYPVWSSCVSSAAFNPLMIANTTNQSQTVNVTLNKELAEIISIIPLSTFNSANGTGSFTCDYDGVAINSQNFVIPAGTTWLGGILAEGGTTQFSLTSSEHNLAFSGGTNPKVYYDLNIGLGAGNAVFKQWQLQYNKTGGVGSTGQQNGLVAVAVTPTSLSSSGATTFTLSNQVLSPYSSSWTNPVTWFNYDAIGFAFL